MEAGASRKERLHELIDFARIYRGWSRVETARALNRDSTKLYPTTENPKMDLVMGLAEVLDWPVADVADYIWNGAPRSTPASAKAAAEDFETLDQQARTAHQSGEYHEMIQSARRMYAVATTPEERARACNREHGGWDGLGRFVNAREATLCGLEESPLSTARRYQLQSNLANTHYTLWELASAMAHSHVVVEHYEHRAPEAAIDRKNLAFALYVRGNTARRLAMSEVGRTAEYCQMAKSDLTRCIQMYKDLGTELGDDRLPGIANTCSGALCEVRVELGEISAADAVAELLAQLERIVEPSSEPRGDWLESYGWCCVFGANIALRRLDGDELQRAMAVFTNKALDIAEQMENWALRERVFTMQYAMHERATQAGDLNHPYVIDDEDKRLITGTMGRFPSFRPTGWRIFRAANALSSVERN